MAALAAALLAHGRPSPLAPVLAAALPWSPLRDERRPADCQGGDSAQVLAADVSWSRALRDAPHEPGGWRDARRAAAYQTAGRPALRGSVAAATEPSVAPGPPSTSSIAWAWPRRAVERGRPGHRVAQRLERLEDAGREARLGADLDRRREVLVAARRTSAARRPPSRRRRRRRRAPTRPGRGSAAGRRRPSSRSRSTARRSPPEQHPGQQRVERPLARREDVRVVRVEAEVRAAVLVVDPGLGIDDAGPEAHVVRLDEADRVAVAVDRREVDRAAAPRRRRRGRRRRPRADRSARRARPRSPSRCSRSTGMSRNSGRSAAASRSAIASFDASIPRWIQRASVDAVRPERRRPAAARTVSRTLRSSRATIPEQFGGWVVTRTPR